MRSIAAAMLFLALPSAALADLVPRSPPGTVRLPGMVNVRVVPTDPFVAHELREAREDIERRRENGEISKREARRLRREAGLIATLNARYSRDGLTDAERRELELRAGTLRARAEAPRPRT